ncbi:MAG: response regulator [Polyangiaceae bacterium]|nr:response regulator [Myxococcales bacterium]MCB9584846.1 response regulator [Polyangiaceae bacterium]MCB9607581.1 response regulator [Polyangiaceae bacterium]
MNDFVLTSQRMLDVLIVDDSADTLEMMALLIRRRGHHVRSAQTATAALEAAQTQAPDLVLLDFGLPDFSGLELARKLRASGVTRATLVAVTGQSRESDRAAALEAGCNDFVTKPLRRKELDRLLVDAEERRGRD